jgi:adenylate kinase
MTGRRSCPKCGAVYHIENLKPKIDGKCDKDGSELIQRPDDTLEVVENRLKTYHKQTEPVVDYYKDNGTVIDIDAGDDVDSVAELIFEKLEALASV